MKCHTIKTLSRNMMHRAIFFVCIIPALITECQADVVWNYLSTDGLSNTVTGQLTTTGNPADAFMDGIEFDLKSIEFTALNDSEIESWFDDLPPPFTFNFDGSITTSGTTGLANITGGLDFIRAESAPSGIGFRNRIVLGAPGGVTKTSADAGLGVNPETSHYRFTPTSTTFTFAVPEPGSCFGLVVAGLGWLLRRKRSIAIPNHS